LCSPAWRLADGPRLMLASEDDASAPPARAGDPPLHQWLESHCVDLLDDALDRGLASAERRPNGVTHSRGQSSNSPALMSLIQALISAWVNRIVPSSRCLLLRMAMCPSGKAATSTQVPLLPLNRLVRQWMAGGSSVPTGCLQPWGCDGGNEPLPGSPLEFLHDYGIAANLGVPLKLESPVSR
jgi:hypothetical protein